MHNEEWIGQAFWTLMYDNWSVDEYDHLSDLAESNMGPNRSRIIDN